MQVTTSRLGLLLCGVALVLLAACDRQVTQPAPFGTTPEAAAPGSAEVGGVALGAPVEDVPLTMTVNGRIEACDPYSPSFRRFGYPLRVDGADIAGVPFFNDGPGPATARVIQPPGTRGFSHEGQVITIWVPVQARSGSFPVTVNLPDGRSVSATIDHRAPAAGAATPCQSSRFRGA